MNHSARAATTELLARAIIQHDSAILVARHVDYSHFFLPGGHVDAGEPVEHALVRKLREELAARTTIVGLRGVVEHGYRQDATPHRDRHEINLVFDVAVETTELHSQEDHLMFTWLSLDQVHAVDLRPHSIKDFLTAHRVATAPWRPWIPFPGPDINKPSLPSVDTEWIRCLLGLPAPAGARSSGASRCCRRGTE